MFTGIIEKTAQVREIKKQGSESFSLELSNPFSTKLKIGESIATNGVCLTVTSFNEKYLRFDVSPATFQATALNGLKKKSKVNLERSLKVGDRISGHWVQGHVDGTAKLTQITENENGYYEVKLSFEKAYRKLLRYCVKKGSISIDGVSLTIQQLNENSLSFQIIPHTWTETNLSDLALGDLVNIEVDILAKYIERLQKYD